METNQPIIAGNLKQYAELSQFRYLDKFNEHYRRILYTFNDSFKRRKVHKRIITVLFKHAHTFVGVSFLKKENIAKLAECSARMVSKFNEVCEELYGIKVVRTIIRGDAVGRCAGGQGHNIYVFTRFVTLEELPTTKEEREALEDVPGGTEKAQALREGIEETKRTSEPKNAAEAKQTPNNDGKKENQIDRDEAIEDELNRNATKYAAKTTGVCREIVEAYAKYQLSYDELVAHIQALKGVMKKDERIFEDYTSEIIDSIDTAFPAYREHMRGQRQGHNPIAFTCGILRKKIEEAEQEAIAEIRRQAGTKAIIYNWLDAEANDSQDEQAEETSNAVPFYNWLEA